MKNNVCIVALVLPVLASAQVATPPSFEVASVRPNFGAKTKRTSTLVYAAQGFEAVAFDLHTIISEAYQIPVARVYVPDAQIHKIIDATYDISAKAEQPAPKDQLRLMLQSLLADRFKLIVRRESKQQGVYRLVVGKQGSKLPTPVTEPGNPVMAFQLDGIDFENVTMTQLCERLSSALDRPVLDATKIQGVYTFSLKIDGMPTKKGAGSKTLSESTIFTDMQQQLGLQLIADKTPMEFIVVTYAEPPSEN